MAELILRPFAPADEGAALVAHRELAADGFDFLLDHDPARPWTDWLRMNEHRAAGIDLPADRVPATFLAAEVDGELVGRSSVRFELNAWLAERGGHVGYGVRPGARRRGYATAILRLSLDVLRGAGVTRALVTCDEGNVASASVIGRCGGVFERHADTGVRRYWIDLSSQTGGADPWPGGVLTGPR